MNYLVSNEEMKMLIHRCHLCQKVLGSNPALYTHLKLTHKVKHERSVDEYSVVTDQKCDHCDTVLKTDIEYVDHLVNEHPNSELPAFIHKTRYIFKCPDCADTFSKLNIYYKHRGGLVPMKVRQSKKKKMLGMPILCPQKQ